MSNLKLTLACWDYGAYGLEPNRPAFEAIGQYVYEQGFSPRAVSPDELFALNM